MTQVPLFHALLWTTEYTTPTHNPAAWSAILDGCQEHRPWFTDHVWNEGPDARRIASSAYIAAAFAGGGRVWDVWCHGEVCGILLLNGVRPHLDAQAHFLFFDHELRTKRRLCLAAMEQVFEDETLNLNALRVELPDYAGKLSGFLRKALGFQYEAQRRLPLDTAKRASIKYQATRYEGKLHDAWLLSITRQEFHSFVRSKREQIERQHGADPGIDPRGHELPSSPARQSESDRPRSAAPERSPATS